MKRKTKEKMIWCRMAVGDHERFMAGYKKTIYRSVSEYARKLLLGVPPTVIYRNRSLDDLIETAVLLRRDLLTLVSKDSFTASEKEGIHSKITNLEDSLTKILEQCSPK